MNPESGCQEARRRGIGKRRLADEYDAAQERGKVREAGKPNSSKAEEVDVADIGLTHKDIHEVRQIREAEEAWTSGSESRIDQT